MLSGRNAAGDVIPGDASLQLCTLVLLLLLSDWSATLYLKATLSFSFFSSSSEIIQSFFFSLFLTCFLPSPHCFVLLNSSHSFCFQTAALHLCACCV